MVAAPENRAAIAFTVGWLSVIAWCLTVASANVFCAQIIMNLASLYNPDFVGTQWQTYLVYVLLCFIAVAVVIYLPRQIPKAEMLFFSASILGFVVFFITVLARSDTKQSARTVFIEWNNQTGWGDGTAFLLGVGACMYTFLATVRVPKSMQTLNVDFNDRTAQLMLPRRCPIQAKESLRQWVSP